LLVIPAAFEYQRANSVDEALSHLREHGSDARILAGGQSLIPAMRFRLARPSVLVDIGSIGGLRYVTRDGGMLALGAMARDSDVERAPWIGEPRWGLVADVSRVVADPIVRQTGTIVGSLCHNDPSGDWTAVALAARAAVIVRGAEGDRTVPIDEFLVDSFVTAVEDGTLAIEARFPVPDDRTSGAYLKVERKVGDFATAAAGVQLSLDENGTIRGAGVALSAAGPTAVRVVEAERILVGQTPTADLLRAAGAAASDASRPQGDLRGGVDYKKHLAGVLVERGLRRTLDRLGVQL
jgi:aerobic carbon-monoxide dehydrogenase medium subunit